MISAASPVRAADALYTWHRLRDQAAPAATFEMENGTHRSLADFKGQVVLLNLWATWCTPCLKELPTLDALEETRAADGLVVLPLSLDTISFVQLREFIDGLGLELPHLAKDDSNAFQRALAGRGLPSTYLIDRSGALRYRYDGATNWLSEEHAQKIDGLLAGK